MSYNNNVELIGWYGGDKAIARAAWTSTQIDIKSKTEEQIRDLIVNKLWNNPTGKPHKCYDSKTEILTSTGWKFFKDLNNKDRVCSVDPETHNYLFELPSEIVSFDYNEPMYYVKNQQIDLAVTKGHRMFISDTKNKTYGKKFKIKTVEEIEGKTVKYLISAQNKRNTNFFSANKAKLIGFFIGDGNITKSLDIRFHLKKKRKIEYLKNLGFEILEQKNNSYIIRDKSIAKFLLDNCYFNKNKCLPSEFINYSAQDILNILDGLKNSDGSIKRNTFVYSTTSEKLKDQLQALASLNGFTFTVSKIIQNNVPIYRLNYSSRITPEIINQPSRMYGNQIEEWKHYKGKVYCVTVSTGLVIVRRNGKVCISGNTPFERGLVEVNIICDQASHIHLLKHRLANINGESARYMELKEDKIYLPEDFKGIQVDKKHHNMNYIGNQVRANWGNYDWYQALFEYAKLGNALYHKCLEDTAKVLGRKRAKESARYFKTMNSQITLSVMMNMSCFANFVDLRGADDAQKEIQYITEQMVEIVKNIEGNPFKYTLEAFGY